MLMHVTRIASVFIIIAMCAVCADLTTSQESPPIRVEPAANPGEVPKGVEVLTRGPVHEAFASPSTEPRATPLIAKKPPTPIEEMPPEERPEGDVVWIGGYFAWDDDRADYLWVSGCWRVKPVGKEWVPGYWREVGPNTQWVAGFWTNTPEQKAQGVTYYPEPPAPPNVAPPGEPPVADNFHIPGHWMWSGDRYVWRAGYWTRVRPGYVYVQSHYRWTPTGYVFVSGYWDYVVARRGTLYAPITVDVVVVGPRYVYTPYYAVRDTIVLDTMFVRPAFGAYYFGDYYGPRYVQIGFEPVVVYSRRHYDPIIVYQRWHHRDNPRWHDTQITLVIERNAGRAPVPPRTLVQQTTIINNNVNVTNVTNVIAPTKIVVAAGGGKVVKIDSATRTQVRATTQANQLALSADRRKSESIIAQPGTTTKPRTTTLGVPATTPIGGPSVLTKNPPSGDSKGAKTTDLSKDTAKTDLGKGRTKTDSKGSTTLPRLDSSPPRDSGKGATTGKTPPKKQPNDKK
ncbi:MAG: hypothetical protein EXR98_07005 [Gemmataceae bacterium]|nr:hypothetical protein [Gemmataceae bacterium]